MRTGIDRIARMASGVAAVIEPDEVMRLRRAQRYAFNRDGTIHPDAIPVDATHFSNVVHDGAGNSTASTTVWATAATMQISLPAGARWKVKAVSNSRIGNTSGSNVDARIMIASTEVVSDTRNGPSSGASPMSLGGSLVVDGGQSITIQVQVKSDTVGTSVMSNVTLDVDFDRA